MQVELIDLILIPVAYIYVFSIILLATKLKNKGKINSVVSRKIVHIGIGILVIIAPILFTSNFIPTIIGITFILITYLTAPISPIPQLKINAFKDGHPLGTVYYSIMLTALLYLYFDKGWLIQIGFLPLVIGDAVANLIGIKYGKHKFNVIKIPDKSLEGTLAAFISTSFILLIVLIVYHFLNLFIPSIFNILWISIIVGLIGSLVELLSIKGLDNLTIPIFCTLCGLLLEKSIFFSSSVKII